MPILDQRSLLNKYQHSLSNINHSILNNNSLLTDEKETSEEELVYLRNIKKRDDNDVIPNVKSDTHELADVALMMSTVPGVRCGLFVVVNVLENCCLLLWFGVDVEVVVRCGCRCFMLLL